MTLAEQLAAIVADYLGPVDEMRDLRHRDTEAWPMLEAYLADLELDSYSPNTLRSYERQIAALLRENPATAFPEFTTEQVKARIGLVPSRTRYLTRSILNGWFEWGEFMDHIEPNQNPMRKVKKFKAGERRPTNLFSEAEVALLTSLPVPDGPLWTLMFGVLLRRGDCVRLQRKHIDLERLRLAIYNGKGGKDAVVPFTPAVAAAVADLDLLLRLEPDDHLWYRRHHNRSRSTPISTSEFARWYARGIEAAGVRYLNPHTTRHTGHWILKHVEKLGLEERQLVLRHKNPETSVRQYPAVDVEDVAALRSVFT